MFELLALLSLVVAFGMAQMFADRPATYVANGAMANRFRFVVITADYTVGYAGAGVYAFGVNLDTADASGRGVAIVTQGSGPTVKLTIGAAVAAGALLKPDAAAKGITAASTERASARAIQAGGADGDLIEVELVNMIVP